MFMTRMSLDINRPETVHALSNPEELQTAVDSMFDGYDVSAVWRIDQLNQRQYLVVVRPIRPSPHRAHEQYGYLGCFPSWETYDYDNELEQITAGSHWQFKCTAAVQLDTEHAAAEQMRMISSFTSQQQTDWLKLRGMESGFIVNESFIEHSHGLFIHNHACETDMMLHQVEFNGILTVTSTAQLIAAMTHGIGLCCQYGLGLITIDEPGAWCHV